MPNEGFTNRQNIEKLRERYKALEKQKITAEANLKNSEENLEKLRKQARENYGTDDLEELQKKLEEMKSDNESKCAEYQRHLDEIETQLNEVEQQHAQASTKETQT